MQTARVRNVVARLMLLGTLAGLGVIAAATQAVAQTAAAAKKPEPTREEQMRMMMQFVGSHFTKHEYRIAMRDGVKLYTVVYTPLASGFADKGPYPFLMSRTPYSCGNYDNATLQPRVTGNMSMLRAGYILVCQDVRGRWESEGTWQEMTPSRYTPDGPTAGHGIDESTDMSDTVDWLLEHVPANNGRVGILGISYPGFYTAASIAYGNPAIKAASPQAPVTDLWMGDDAYHGGAAMLLANHSFYASFFGPQKNPLKVEPKNNFSFGTDDMYAYYLKMGTLQQLDSPAGGTNPYFHDQVVHTSYGPYWQARDIAAHMFGVKAATMEVGGWFDAEDLSGPVKIFHAINQQSPGSPANSLVEGPWVHGGWSRGTGASLGDVEFGSDTAEFYRTTIEAPFFAHYLKDTPWPGGDALPKAYTFETGTDVWKKYAAWPPKAARSTMIYLQPEGGLAFTKPSMAASSDSYVSDPAHPVPFTPYITGTDVPQRYMDDDQRFDETRGDVVSYVSAPLTDNITIVGPIKPKLRIASTGTDSDFIVKLIDVFPEGFTYPDEAHTEGKRDLGAPPVYMGGYEMMVRGEPFRAKYRDSWTDPSPLVPGKVTAVDFTMQDVNHTFLKGHRIMVQIQSSWFPLVDRNPQTFVDIYKATPADYVKATETIYHQADAASGVELLVMPQ